MQTARSLSVNTFFSIFSTLLNRVGNTLLFILIIQRTSVSTGGVYDLGIAYFLITSRLTLFGLSNIITRDVAAEHSQAEKYFSNFLSIRITLATASVILAALLIAATNYDPSTKQIVIVMIIAVIPANINDLCSGMYAAFEELYFDSIATLLNASVRLIVGTTLIYLGYELLVVATVLLVGHLSAMVVNLVIVHKRYIRKWRGVDISFLKTQWPVALPFLVIGVFYILDSRLDKVLMSFLSNEETIGIYGAATAIIVALSLVPEAYRIAVLPVMSRLKRHNMLMMQILFRRSQKFLLILSLPLTIATILLSEKLVHFIYQKDLPQAVLALRILASSLVFIFLTSLYTRLLLVYNKHNLTARFMLIGAVINIVIIIWLIPPLGAAGAAIGTVTSITIRFILLARVASRLIERTGVFSYLWRLVLATTIMGIVILQLAPQALWWQILAGSLIYLFAIFLTGAVSPEERHILSNYGKKTFLKVQSWYD